MLQELIDDCGHEVLFFADEGGSWLVGVGWGQVLPVWIRVLSASTDAKGFATAVVDRHRRLPPSVTCVLGFVSSPSRRSPSCSSASSSMERCGPGRGPPGEGAAGCPLRSEPWPTYQYT